MGFVSSYFFSFDRRNMNSAFIQLSYNYTNVAKPREGVLDNFSQK